MLDGEKYEMLSFVQDMAAVPVQSMQLELLRNTRPGSVGISVAPPTGFSGFERKR